MADVDLLTPDEARQFVDLGQGDGTRELVFGMAITAASRRLAKACGPIVSGTIVNETHDGGCGWLYLNKSPVLSVQSVVEYDGTTAGTLTAESVTSQTTNQYNIRLTNGKLTRRDSGATTMFPRGLDNILVSYTPGRYATTDDVDAEFKEACGIVLKNWWRMFESSVGEMGGYDVPQGSFPTYSVPRAAKELLAEEWREGSGFAG